MTVNIQGYQVLIDDEGYDKFKLVNWGVQDERRATEVITEVSNG